MDDNPDTDKLSATVARQGQLAREGSAAASTAIFLHIGKTAGTTLNAIVRQRYPHHRALAVDSHRAEPAHDQLARLGERRLRQARLVRGHVMYGIHTVLPGPALYFTFVRSPRARLISAYHHVRNNPSHRLHRRVVDERITFPEFVRGGLTLENDNWQTRCIAGDTTTPFGACGTAMLGRAKTNIERHFALVGLSERFDESLVVLARMYSWRGVCYVPLNAARSDGPPFDVGEVDWAALDPHTVVDEELHRYAAELLDAVVARVPDIPRALEALRRRNALYAPLGRSLDHLWQPVRVWKGARQASH